MNMREMEQWLEAEVDDLDWTVVRPGGLANKPLQEQTPLQEAACSYLEPGRHVDSRASSPPQFMLQLAEDKYVRKVVAIALKWSAPGSGMRRTRNVAILVCLRHVMRHLTGDWYRGGETCRRGLLLLFVSLWLM